MPIDPETFKTRDAISYSAVADRFAYWTERVTLPLANRLIERAQLMPGERILDVGTGSGIVAIAAAQKVGPHGKVVGVDLSEGMLNKARTKSNLEFRRMDAEHLDLEPASFDAVVSLFALLHFPNPEQALREMFRVVRPGGRVVVGIGSGMPLFGAGIKPVLSRLWEYGNAARGKVLVAPQALDRFIETRLPQPSEHETVNAIHRRPLKVLLKNAGFQAQRSEWAGYTHKIGTPAEFWDLQATFSSVVRKRLECAPDALVQALREEFCRKCEKVVAKGGALIYRNAALLTHATRPAEPISPARVPIRP